jgi:hypothetical protein
MAISVEGTGMLYAERLKADVLEKLDRLLENSHFSNSKRFPSFLRFVVQEELEGRGDQLKERTLGLEVFGRDPGYDTTSDPIVRVTAAEIRKRIAQFYQEPGNGDQLRISLPPGSYVPHFVWPTKAARLALFAPVERSELASAQTEPVTELSPLPVLAPARDPNSIGNARAAKHHLLFWISFAIALIAVAICVTAWARTRPSALDRFWAPMLNSGAPVFVCFPRNRVDTIRLRNATAPEQQQVLSEKNSAVMVDDLQPMVAISGLLEMRHQPYDLMGEDSATPTDLRHGPTVFLGAFDNAWTLRVTHGLRYRFSNDPAMKYFWIEDTQSPARWQIDRGQQMATNNYRDYAIVARFVDANTGQIAVVSAGIAHGGTVAAGEFLTQAADMASIKAHAPKNWDGQNMEVVLSTEIIDGRSAPPKIEATYFW